MPTFIVAHTHSTAPAALQKYTEAEPLYREALEARRRVLGPDHPSTITSINNWAGCLLDMGRVGEALPLYRQALAAR
jgi:hypothetical protein